MCTDFPLMQTELVASIPLFVDHTEANLVSYDITPTGCINACFKDNRTVCAQVTEDTVRQFVRLAAQEKAPRFLRFLRMITMPNDQVIKRNQMMVLQALAEKEAALLLYNDPQEQAERKELIEAQVTGCHFHHLHAFTTSTSTSPPPFPSPYRTTSTTRAAVWCTTWSSSGCSRSAAPARTRRARCSSASCCPSPISFSSACSPS